MQEVFEKLKQRISICATEACGYTPLTRVVSEAELKEIIEKTYEECRNGHFGCNTNGEHERCDGCGLTSCKIRNKCWFGELNDASDTNYKPKFVQKCVNPSSQEEREELNKKIRSIPVVTYPTNADRIRSLSDEELAGFLCKVKADYQWEDHEFPSEAECGKWEEWLQSEVEK